MFDVLKYYEGIRARTDNLPDWNSLHPQHQSMMLQSINLMLQVMHDNNAVGKATEGADNA